MPTTDEPLFVLPHGSKKSSVYVCTPVDPELSSRSEVMSSLMETAGLAELPEGVSLGNFLSWSSIALDEMSGLPVAELATALEVSDIMSDKATPKMADAMAEVVAQTDWSEASAAANKTQDKLLTLPDNLRALVFERIIATLSIKDVLGRWPLAMQMTYFDALVSTPPHAVMVPNESQAPASLLSDTFTLLTHTAPSPPGLQTLTILPPFTSGSHPTLVAAALAHHASSLAELTLPSLFMQTEPADQRAPGPATQVLAALPRLSFLTSLTLQSYDLTRGFNHLADQHILSPEDAAAFLHHLASALKALPALAEAHLGDFAFTVSPTAAGKRRKLTPGSAAAAEADAAVSLDPVIAALSTAPALTCLTIGSSIINSAPVIPRSGIRGPFTSLKVLEMHHRLVPAAATGDPGPLATPLWHVAPLPSLANMAFVCSGGALPPAKVNMAFETAAQQLALRSAVFSVSYAPAEGALEGLPRLTQLESLNLFPQPPPGQGLPTLRVAAEGAGQLTRLHTLSLSMRRTRLSDDLNAGVDPGNALVPLQSLTQLQCLRLHLDDLTGEDEVFESAVLGLRVDTFSSLTCLDLRDGPLTAAALLPQVSRLTRLHNLGINMLLGETRENLRAGLSPLTALAFFNVTVQSFSEAKVTGLAACFAAMPDLIVAEVSADDRAEPGWLSGLLALPERAGVKYAFSADQFQAEGEYEGVQRQLAARGARMPVQMPVCGTLQVAF